ncbi:transposase [Arcanobacterium phocae]|nr:transposase [Arcanobacterium phocae]
MVSSKLPTTSKLVLPGNILSTPRSINVLAILPCAIEHFEHLKSQLGALPTTIIADGGYGSEQNYAYLDQHNVRALVKHAEFYRLMKNKKWRDDPFRSANWPYDHNTDTYQCPNHQTLTYQRTQHETSDLGYTTSTRIYQCLSCQDCPVKSRCTNSKQPGFCKIITVNPTKKAYKDKATADLRTDSGKHLRKQRAVDVETVFGDIKHNYHFTRFTLRGKRKVTTEFQWIALEHNLRKVHHHNTKAEQEKENTNN